MQVDGGAHTEARRDADALNTVSGNPSPVSRSWDVRDATSQFAIQRQSGTPPKPGQLHHVDRQWNQNAREVHVARKNYLLFHRLAVPRHAPCAAPPEDVENAVDGRIDQRHEPRDDGRNGRLQVGRQQAAYFGCKPAVRNRTVTAVGSAAEDGGAASDVVERAHGAS
ncbi:hypothetical protein J3458_019060 [Metarhizium acridum]|uniref:uncharacterized protein n=1 Tax=Metarhizium acridum TaxID=92637 RepID=UPI001C6C2547|nr:hypothetical protein J3458_019060 [Metarhizium acridum]